MRGDQLMLPKSNYLSFFSCFLYGFPQNVVKGGGSITCGGMGVDCPLMSPVVGGGWTSRCINALCSHGHVPGVFGPPSCFPKALGVGGISVGPTPPHQTQVCRFSKPCSHKAAKQTVSASHKNPSQFYVNTTGDLPVVNRKP